MQNRLGLQPAPPVFSNLPPRGLDLAPIRFVIGFPDGSRTREGPAAPAAPDDPSSTPFLLSRGGGGNSERWRQDWWLAPLPPEGKVTFAVAFEAAGVTESVAEVDGGVFAEAAAKAEQLWPESTTTDPGPTVRSITLSGATAEPDPPD
jgi:hypothetical protein